MKKEGFYTSGEFAKKAHVTLRTIRWYDKKNLLRPSYRTESGNRLYTDGDLAKLQQILLFKYLGFSLDDIREMTLTSTDEDFLLGSLEIQKKLVQERISELNDVHKALCDTTEAIENHESIDWNQMLNLIHMTSADQSLKTQYQDATNVSARIKLHKEYSTNKQGWFPWLLQQISLKEDMHILEIGCGNGALWKENLDVLPKNIHITLSDISEGMLRDAKESIGKDTRFTYKRFDCHKIPFKEQTFDLVIANHVLFYFNDIDVVLKECKRVLKDTGTFVCSTYGSKHMKEITDLVQEFDKEIVLSSDCLYEIFGLENGKEILSKYFHTIKEVDYIDSIEVNEAEPLIAYIISCHGNQNHILLDHYREFREFVEDKTKDGFHISKDAGIYICKQ
jgi:ubiquinone/menaquinone biosynthesis C-methylase UbiE/DNA-binding transcriptional MerR regulator